MPRSGYYQQRCPCGKHGYTDGAPRVAVTIAVSTIRTNPRRKAPASTIYPCPDCLRKIHAQQGRAVRRELAAAVQRAARTLAVESGASKG